MIGSVIDFRQIQSTWYILIPALVKRTGTEYGLQLVTSWVPLVYVVALFSDFFPLRYKMVMDCITSGVRIILHYPIWAILKRTGHWYSLTSENKNARYQRLWRVSHTLRLSRVCFSMV
jgi:hypothetical protein